MQIICQFKNSVFQGNTEYIKQRRQSMLLLWIILFLILLLRVVNLSYYIMVRDYLVILKYYIIARDNLVPLYYVSLLSCPIVL